MKGYCAWPGRVSSKFLVHFLSIISLNVYHFQIVEATDDLQKIRKTEKSTLVYFFGSKN